VRDIEQPILIEDTAPSGHTKAVARTFERAGFKVEVKAEYGRKAADVLPWVVRAVVLVPIAAFFASFGGEAGKDAYASVKEWVRDVWESRKGAGTEEASLVLMDSDASQLILSSSLPNEALDALRRIDWREKHGGYLVWDSAEREWRDATPRRSARLPKSTESRSGS
jgi:hypothetical protein